MDSQRGLGQSLRQLLELSDLDMDSWYQQLPFPYRARYTPILSLLAQGPQIVGQLSEALSITQGAVSQTIRLMAGDGLIEKKQGQDGRQSVIALSPLGEQALQILQPHWEAIFQALEQLEKEIAVPLREHLHLAAQALQANSFSRRVELQKANSPAPPCSPLALQNPFSIAAADYQKFRPSYPQQLGLALYELCDQHALAIDVGCGNGQLSTLLADYFDQVLAVDSSAEQIQYSQLRDNISYQVGSAESMSQVADASADLIVAAQAAHWFDLGAFYQEVRRVAKAGARLALISYGVPYIEGPLNAIFQQAYWQDCFKYWPPQRRAVENGYADLYFPFKEESLANVSIEQAMSFEDLLAYVKTWSAYKAAKQKNEQGVFYRCFERLQKQWGDSPTQTVRWPIAARVGKL